MFKFEVPSLTVGTLDTLMTLSDELVKTDGVVEQTVRKIERTTAELFNHKSSDLTVGGESMITVLSGPFAYFGFIICWFLTFDYSHPQLYPLTSVNKPTL